MNLFRSIFNTVCVPKFVYPILPPELEREIFEIAARAYPECALRLVLVAHRALIWIEPFIYETVILGRSRLGEVHQFLRTLGSRPASFFATHVKTLILTNVVKAEEAARILSICTGVINLTCSVSSSSLLPPMDDICRLQRLSIIVPVRPITEPDFNQALFASVTHLEIITDHNIWTTWSPSWCSRLPRLTHLALSFKGDARFANLSDLHSLPPSLKVLAILAHNDYVSRATLDLVSENFADPRVTFMREGDHLRDWLGGLRGLQDMWARAENIVAAQSGSTS